MKLGLSPAPKIVAINSCSIITSIESNVRGFAPGPETVDRALIGCTRRENPITKTVDFTRISSNGSRNPALEGNTRESVISRIHPVIESRRLIFQLGTADPSTAVQAARLVARDIAGIEVNAGCPKPFSTTGGMGAALLRTPDKLVAILEALVASVGREFDIGVSVKIRLLETAEETEALVQALVKTGITGLTVHCRTTPMRPRERAIREQLRMIAGICREAGVACVMNGDVKDRDEAEKLIEEYGVDGAMIATAAERNPSCFRTSEQGGLLHWSEVVREYMTAALAVDNRWGNTKFLLSQLMPGKDPRYMKVAQSASYVGVVEALGFDDLAERAAELDRRLAFDQEGKQTGKRARAKEVAAAQGVKKAAQQKKPKKVAVEESVAFPLTDMSSQATPLMAG